MNLQVRIGQLPSQQVQASDFEVCSVPIPVPGSGEVLVRHLFLSLDPYMRKRLADAVAGRIRLAAGDAMMGRTLGEVVESRDPGLHVGDLVLGWGGWQQYAVEAASRLKRVERLPGHALSIYMGALGRPGITAWLGLMHVARVRKGEHVVVSSAAGAVGGLASQIACYLGATVTGIAGGPAKCRDVVDELGLHACVDYKSPDFETFLREATPRGVDLCFENVGGAILDATLNRMNENGRIAVCGLLSQYHTGEPYGYRNFARVLDQGLHVTGFRIDAHTELHERAYRDLRAWVQAGVLRSWETVSHGLENAPAAFVAMLEGHGRGKSIVQLV